MFTDFANYDVEAKPPNTHQSQVHFPTNCHTNSHPLTYS